MCICTVYVCYVYYMHLINVGWGAVSGTVPGPIKFMVLCWKVIGSLCKDHQN